MKPVVCASLWLTILFSAQGFAQPEAAFEALRERAEQEGWTFSVAENEATAYPIDRLCGLVPPKNWRAGAVFRSFGEKGGVPEVLDLRPYCTPVRNQGGCGSCWAFGTVGVLESLIKLKDNVERDLSEQWLVSCNTETEPPHLLRKGEWGCEGGWFAHDYHEWKPDPCGGSGAVLESQFPYVAEDAPCGCPYAHAYWIDAWAYIAGEDEIPSVNAIKQAILDYGPVSAAVYADEAFTHYHGGVFNASQLEEPNHAVILAGWDDTMGANGAWILRNSWGQSWGIGGYMYIEYGCSNVGYGACFVEYTGTGQGEGPAVAVHADRAVVEEGGSLTLHAIASGIGGLHYHWQKDGMPVGEDLDSLTISVAEADDAGTYACEVSDLRGISLSGGFRIEVVEAGSLPASQRWTQISLLLACAFAALLLLPRQRRRA